VGDPRFDRRFVVALALELELRDFDLHRTEALR